MGAIGLIGIIKSLAAGTNAAATALTLESGLDWAANKGADLKASVEFRELAEMISYENVAKDLKPYYADVDEYISGHHYKLAQVILTDEYRKEFTDTFYKTHPLCLVLQEEVNALLKEYLDRLEMVFQKKFTLGEKFIIQGIDELKKLDRETMAKQDYMCQILEKMFSELQLIRKDASASTPVPPPPANIESLSFYKVRQLTNGLWVNWETGRLAEDFGSVWKKEDDAETVQDTGESKRQLSPAQLRLLSVLVQGEGASVSWKDIFWRGKLTERFLEKYSANDLSRTVHDYLRNGREEASWLKELSSEEFSADLFEVGGEHFEEGEKVHRRACRKHVAEIILDYLTSVIGEPFKKHDKNPDAGIIRQEASYTVTALRRGSYVFPEEIVRAAGQSAIDDLREADAELKNIIGAVKKQP